ncbi:MAG: hypothetical protein JW881_21255 [Spirochaetales bacterium]|nr:hypothetical protein [Spirochaetales bacterium]
MKNGNPNHYHIAMASDWEYDLDFFHMIEAAAADRGLSAYYIHPKNLDDVYTLLQQDKVSFDFYIDRASDTTPSFIGLQHLAAGKHIRVLDPVHKIEWALDKATMHLEFISHHLITPFTIILPPYDSKEKCYLSLEDLYRLGHPFIIKPAVITGGGIGIVDGAERLYDILMARQEFKSDKYLLQEKIIPYEADGKRFWFRGFYCCGAIHCVWWNDTSHIYEELLPEEIETYQLHELFTIVEKIARICDLQFFSTEITKNKNNQFVIIDYVNPSCDMRPKSKHEDGVPDAVVKAVAGEIIAFTLSGT